LFRRGCEYGHFEMTQWLYGLGGVNIHARDDYSFRNACSNGHLTVAQWLYELEGISPVVLQSCLKLSEGNLVGVWLESIVS
jgi:hypothetical protein